MPLERALFLQIVEFLVPHVIDGQERRTLVQAALGHLKVINLLEWVGNAHDFAVHLVTSLDRWGDNTLELLLTQLSSNVGLDHEETIQALIAQIRATTQTGHWEGSPFPGLQAFQERHEPIFFGREQEIYRLAEMVRQKPLVAVIGASGSGKSSLIQAGVITRLRQSRTEQWHIIRFTPDQAGVKHPFASLRSALGQQWQVDLPSPDELAEQPALLKDVCQNWLAAPQRLLLLADQFEETFTTIAPTLRTPFIQALCALLDLPQIHIVLTLRSDFSEHCLNEPDLVDRLRQQIYVLSRPQPWALHQMIDGPAKAAQIKLEGGLIETILSDTGSEPGNLALLAYTLDELYKIADSRRDRTILMDDYATLGGVQGAIGKRAEKAFDDLKLPLPDKAMLLAHVFRDLVEVDDRGTATRKRAQLATIAAEEQKLITAFTKARLLVSDEGWVEVAHEALFRSWERLKAWIAEAQEDLILLRQVQNAAYHWDRIGRPDYLLWQQERLNQVYEMQSRLHTTLTDVEQAFLKPEADRLLEEFRSDTRQHRRRSIIDRRSTIGEQALETMLASLQVDIGGEGRSGSGMVVNAIVKALKPYITVAVPRIIDELGSQEAYRRRQSVIILEKLEDLRAVPTLIEALKDEDYSVRESAARTLGKLGALEAVPALINALRGENRYIAESIVEALKSLKDLRAVPVFIDKLNEENPYLRWRLVSALGDLGDLQAVPTLISLLGDKDDSVQRNAIRALGQLKDPRGVPELIKLINSKYIEVIGYATLALVDIGDERGLQALRSNSQISTILKRFMRIPFVYEAKVINALEIIGTPEALAVVNQWRQEHPDKDDT
jgi:hypothetical protein